MLAPDSRRYIRIVTFRVSVAVLALLTAAWAGHINNGDGSVWLLASLLSASTAGLLIWPLVVPSRNGTMSVYSLGYAFLLAGIFLLPPAALAIAITFALTLAGIVTGTRAYRIVSQLSSAVLAFVGFSLVFSLGPRPEDFQFKPGLRAWLELMIAAAALVLLLIIRSIALRVEQGDDTPRWGAFQPTAIVEAIFCLVFSVSITVLTRINMWLLAVVYVEIGIMLWFLHRYRVYAHGPMRIPVEAPVLVPVEGGAAAAQRGEEEEWKPARVRRVR
jgi:uncharacterized membrane protein